MRFQSAIRTAQIFGVSLLGVGLANLVKPSVASAQVCNVYGCSQPGAGACNVYGCPQPGSGSCNVYGCPNVGANQCNVYGCPAAPLPNNNSNPTTNSAQTSRSFRVVNNSGVEFYYFYASPSGEGSWSSDLLGDNTLPNNQAWSLTLSRSCQYDFQAQTYSGSTMVWRDIDVCNRNSITLTP